MIKTLAIFSPAQNAYSETFIQAHKTLPFQIKFYYNGYLPTQLEGQKSLIEFSIKERIEKRIQGKFNLQEYALLYSLKREKVDCVLAEYGPTACESLEVLKFLNLPLVVHFHGYDASIKTILEKYKDAYRNVFAYARTVIAVSNKMKQALIEIGCPEKKIIVSPCGPEPVFFDIKPTYDSQQFISIGRFVPKKAPYLTILAFKKVVEKFPGAKLIMVGDGELLGVCKNVSVALNLENNIEFKGEQTPKEIRNLLQESIAFVQHSIIAENGDSEGTPVSVLEAQAATLPVISTFHAGIPDVVVNNETGFLVQEGDVEEMAKWMIKVLEDKKLAAQLGRAGRERMKEYFSQEKHLKQIEEAVLKATVS